MKNVLLNTDTGEVSYPNVFKTHYNAVPYVGETNTEDSKTVPNQVLSIAEHLERYARGINTTNSLGTPVYNPDAHFPLVGIDKLDMLELAKMEAAKIANIKSEIAARRELLLKQAAEKAAQQAADKAAQ